MKSCLQIPLVCTLSGAVPPGKEPNICFVLVFVVALSLAPFRIDIFVVGFIFLFLFQASASCEIGMGLVVVVGLNQA